MSKSWLKARALDAAKELTHLGLMRDSPQFQDEAAEVIAKLAREFAKRALVAREGFGRDWCDAVGKDFDKAIADADKDE